MQRPVALAEDWTEYAPGKTFNVTGWGTLSDSYAKWGSVMHWVEVPYVPLDVCREIFRPVVKVKIIPGMLCGGEYYRTILHFSIDRIPPFQNHLRNVILLAIFRN